MRVARPMLMCTTALMVVALSVTTLPAHAQGVSFVTPQDGDTVRDMVRLEAAKPNPEDGWISYKIQKGGTGDFVAAITQPFVYVWDTRARDEAGKELYGDGQYTITAVALSPRGSKMGEASITVTVKNAVSASERPPTVEPRLIYERNQQVYYTARGSWTIKPAPNEEDPDEVYEMAKEANGAMVANWKNKVMSPTIAGGHALLHVIVGSAGEQMGTEAVAALPEAGNSHTYVALQDGTMRLKHDDDRSFRYAELFLQLPDRPLKEGDTWTSQMRILPVPQTDTDMRTVNAQHRVEGFEWVNGHKCVRIRSTFSVKKEKLKLRLQPKAEQQAIFGEQPMDIAPMGEMMMMEPGAMGMEGMMAGPPEVESDYTGERVTYWAFDVNRPVRIVDTITHSLEIERAAMMVDMGMTEGQFMPGMEAMPAGPEGMAPGGEPGMEGFGGAMQQMEPPKPLKVRINVSLVIEEVTHAQGLR